MKTTPLHAAHKALNARMGAFAGYDMPLFYADGVMKEHEWTRSRAGLFDVSHMGQVTISGLGIAAFWESLTPSPFSKNRDGQARYTVLTNDAGGITDDLIVTRITENKWYAVLNAGRKHADLDILRARLPLPLSLDYSEEQALLALQGPKAQKALKDVFGIDLDDLPYMHGRQCSIGFISRLGYTGEDGFELSVAADEAGDVWGRLLAHDDVRPVGLAARDSLRLEMGYCLYGHDIDETTTPVEADLGWVIGRDNAGFPGADTVRKQMKDGPVRRRIGVKLTGPGIAREGALLLDGEGKRIGTLTSGGFSPTLQQAIGQGYVDSAHAEPGTTITVEVRGRPIPAVIHAMPFITPKTRTARKQAAA